MKIPSESMIEAALSETKSHSESNRDGSKEKHVESCDFCQIQEEMTKRNEFAGEGKLCHLDGTVLDICRGDPFLGMMVSSPMTGPAILETLLSIGRVCFILGLKSQSTQAEMNKMEELFHKE